MGTTRKNSKDFPEILLQIKDLNQALLYRGSLAIIKGVLCFVWQDNNVVLGITTAFSLHTEKDSVLRDRRRPGDASTNARIALSIFDKDWVKRLPIPTAIDGYNHGMNAVDVANQLRANFSCHLAFERRNWRPLAWWLFDVYLVNSYVIWRQRQPLNK
jgi:Transposase IS4